jgi:hypothetical protein
LAKEETAMFKTFYTPFAVIAFLTTAAFAADAPQWRTIAEQSTVTFQNSAVSPQPIATNITSATVQTSASGDLRGGAFLISFDVTGLYIPAGMINEKDPEKIKAFNIQPLTATLSSTDIGSGNGGYMLQGDLKIGNIARPVIIPLKAEEGGNARIGRTLRLSGRIVINRPSFADTGMSWFGPGNVPVEFSVLSVANPVAEAAPVPSQPAGTATPAPTQRPVAPALPPNQIRPPSR